MMATSKEEYSGKVTPIGNSKGIRLDAAFFRTHPEFNGDVRATVLADGQVLLSAKAPRHSKRSRDESDDPVILSLLKFLEREMTARPNLIHPADEKQLKRIGKLVKGVEVD